MFCKVLRVLPFSPRGTAFCFGLPLAKILPGRGSSWTAHIFGAGLLLVANGGREVLLCQVSAAAGDSRGRGAAAVVEPSTAPPPVHVIDVHEEGRLLVLAHGGAPGARAEDASLSGAPSYLYPSEPMAAALRAVSAATFETESAIHAAGSTAAELVTTALSPAKPWLR